MIPTCLDCRQVNLEAMPGPGDACFMCVGKLVVVKANGSNFKAKPLQADPDPYENTMAHAVVEVMEAEDPT